MWAARRFKLAFNIVVTIKSVVVNVIALIRHTARTFFPAKLRNRAIHKIFFTWGTKKWTNYPLKILDVEIFQWKKNFLSFVFLLETLCMSSFFKKNHFIFDFVQMSRIIQTRFCCPNSNTIAIDHTVCASCVYNVHTVWKMFGCIIRSIYLVYGAWNGLNFHFAATFYYLWALHFDFVLLVRLNKTDPSLSFCASQSM